MLTNMTPLNARYLNVGAATNVIVIKIVYLITFNVRVAPTVDIEIKIFNESHFR